MWAVRTVSEVDVSKPTRVVSTGPYALSRNPMYVAWTVLYVGIALIINALWPLLLLPVVLASTHFLAVLREERRLAELFGIEYADYRQEVRRYV